MNVGQTVRIIKVPADAPPILGHVAVVTELLREGWAYVDVLGPAGGTTHCGALPFDCLESDGGPEAVALAAAREAIQERAAARAVAHIKRVTEAIDQTAAETGVSAQTVTRILNVWEKHRPREP